MCAIPGDILRPSIGRLRTQGFSDPSDLVEELTERYVGQLLEHAFHVDAISMSSGHLADEVAGRSGNLDVVTDYPGKSPFPHDVTGSITNPPRGVGKPYASQSLSAHRPL